MTACANNNKPPPAPEVIQVPVEKIVIRYPEKPGPELLTCTDEPIVPIELTQAGATDVQAAAFNQTALEAGADCRSKLDALKKWVDMWPMQQLISEIE